VIRPGGEGSPPVLRRAGDAKDAQPASLRSSLGSGNDFPLLRRALDDRD
jgi:hypothetical protein